MVQPSIRELVTDFKTTVEAAIAQGSFGNRTFALGDFIFSRGGLEASDDAPVWKFGTHARLEASAQQRLSGAAFGLIILATEDRYRLERVIKSLPDASAVTQRPLTLEEMEQAVAVVHSPHLRAAEIGHLSLLAEDEIAYLEQEQIEPEWAHIVGAPLPFGVVDSAGADAQHATISPGRGPHIAL